MRQDVPRAETEAAPPSSSLALTSASDEPSESLSPPNGPAVMTGRRMQASIPVQVKVEATSPVTPAVIAPAASMSVPRQDPRTATSVQEPNHNPAQKPAQKQQPSRRTYYWPLDSVRSPPTWNMDWNRAVCANCDQRGHQVRECVGPLDDMGCITGCPVCNTRKHRFEICPFRTIVSPENKKKLVYGLLVYWRQSSLPSVPTFAGSRHGRRLVAGVTSSCPFPRNRPSARPGLTGRHSTMPKTMAYLIGILLYPHCAHTQAYGPGQRGGAPARDRRR